jgi:hypothetical protein
VPLFKDRLVNAVRCGTFTTVQEHRLSELLSVKQTVTTLTAQVITKSSNVLPVHGLIRDSRQKARLVLLEQLELLELKDQ